jgi:methylthioribose-1-phosphate isomerase
MNLESGDDISIEQRDPEEVTHLAGQNASRPKACGPSARHST